MTLAVSAPAPVEARPARRRNRLIDRCGLRVWLGLLVCAPLLPMVAWSVYDAARDARVLRDHAEERLAASVQQRGRRVAIILRGLHTVAGATSVALEPHVDDPVRALVVIGQLDQRTPADLRELALVDPDGRIVAASYGTPAMWRDIDLSTQPHLREALARRNGVAGLSPSGREAGRKLLSVAYPVLDRRMQPAGAVVVGIGLDSLSAVLDGPNADLAAASVAVLDAAGNPVVVQERGLSVAAFSRCGPVGGVRADVLDDGTPVLAAAGGVGDSGWRVCAVLPWASDAQALWGDIRGDAGVFALTLLAAMVIAALFATRLIAATHALQEGARRLVSGEPGYRVALAGPAETQALARDFNRMADTLATERERLVASEQRWKFALEGAQAGVWDWHVPSRTLWVSRQWLELLGIPEFPQLAETVEWDARVHPDERAAVHARIAEFVRRDRPFTIEHRQRHADGSWRWIEARGLVTERNARGTPVRVIGTFTDLTARRQSEAALREAEARWQYALESTGQGVWDLDIATGHTWRSPQYLATLGFAPGELPETREAWTERLHPEDLPAMQAELRRVIAGDSEKHSDEFRIRHRDGRWLWCEAQGRVVERDPLGRPLRVIGVFRDISARKNAAMEHERLVADREKLAARLQQQFQVMPIACLVRDADYRVLEVNPAAERLFGWSLAEYAGRDMLDMLVAPEAREAARAVRARLLAGEQTVRIVNDSLTRDGGRLTCEWHIVRMADSDRVLGMAIDITERTRAEQTLRESEARYRDLVDVAPDGVVVLRGGRIEYANEAMGRIAHAAQAGELVGRNFLDLFAPAEREALAERLKRLEECVGPGSSSEHQMTPADGSLVDVDIRTASYRWNDGVHVQAIVRDNTARKLIHRRVLQINVELEKRVEARTAELRAAVGELEAFSYSVAHDLRAPLRAIDGYARILAEDLAAVSSPDVDRSIARIRANIGRMSELIDDLLEYARVGRRELAVEDVDLDAMVRGLADGLQGANPGTLIRIAPLPVVHGDATLLRQVFANVLSNALKFSAKSAAPLVEVGYRLQDDEHVCFVRDNGVGFSMEYADKLFGMFQRLHSPSEFEGSGVGLAIVQRALQRHGGRIWAESEPGRGATFHVALPG